MNRKTILLVAVPVGLVGGMGLGYYLMLMRQKKVTVKVSPSDTTLCQTYQTVTVTAKTGLGKPIANAPGTLATYIGGQKVGTDFTFATDAAGAWSVTLCWQSSGSGTMDTTTYVPVSYVATVAGAVGTGAGRIVIPAGTVLPCLCPTG